MTEIGPGGGHRHVEAFCLMTYRSDDGADDESAVVLWPGDQAEVDVLAPGQTVVFDVEESNP